MTDQTSAWNIPSASLEMSSASCPANIIRPSCSSFPSKGGVETDGFFSSSRDPKNYEAPRCGDPDGARSFGPKVRGAERSFFPYVRCSNQRRTREGLKRSFASLETGLRSTPMMIKHHRLMMRWAGNEREQSPLQVDRLRHARSTAFSEKQGRLKINAVASMR